MKTKPTVGIITIILGLLIALFPNLIFPVCTKMIELLNGKSIFMKCHWTAMAEMLMGILILINGILLIAFKNHKARLALSIILFLHGLASLLMATVVIGMCGTATMPCRVATEPALIVTCVIIMVVGIGNIIFQIGSIKKGS